LIGHGWQSGYNESSSDAGLQGDTLNHRQKEQFAHVLWIGGATDTGKSTIAQNLAERYDMSVYHYDKTDAAHLEKLTSTVPEIRKFMDASLDERWVYPVPGAMLEFLLLSFSQRFPLVLEDLLALPDDRPIIVEGFGLLPELVGPLLSSPYQAVWLVPTENFKWDSMTRRGKPSFAKETSDPEKAKMNLFARDRLLADYYRRQVLAYGYTLYEVDGSRSVAEMTSLVADHVVNYLDYLR
jgi:hypothetical protein